MTTRKQRFISFTIAASLLGLAAIASAQTMPRDDRTLPQQGPYGDSGMMESGMRQ